VPSKMLDILRLSTAGEHYREAAMPEVVPTYIWQRSAPQERLEMTTVALKRP
jgi:hypothetical protein